MLLSPDTSWKRARADSVSVIVDAADYFAAFAHAVRHARAQVVIVGWDVDGRTTLAPNVEAGRAHEAGLLPVLCEALQQNPALEVHVLAWDFSPIYWFEREDATGEKFRRAHARIHFHYDDVHPAGASHHQKFVVIDEQLAFMGGVDLTIRRWDSVQHTPDDAQRVDHEGVPYAPMHDVQLAITGDAARAFAELARERFVRAGKTLPPCTSQGDVADLWAAQLGHDFGDVDVAITRTRSPAFPNDPEIRESERATLAVIAGARSSVYVENQYLTAARITEAIAERLGEPDGPEWVIVLPRGECGWLERRLMGELRRRSLARLRAADVHGKLRLVYPVVDEPDTTVLNVHSKLLVVDQRVLKVGSSNFSNRSMGLDSECDVWIEREAADADVRRVLARLLAEHTGGDAGAVFARLEAGASLIELVDTLGEPGRRFGALDVSADAPDLTPLSVSLFDPERPEVPEAMVDVVLPLRPHAPRRRVVLSLALTLGALGIIAVAAYAAQDHARALIEDLRNTTDTPLGYVSAVLLYSLAALAFVPITLLITTVALVFEPLKAIPVMFVGSMLAAASGHAVGRTFKRGVIRMLGQGRLERIRSRVVQHGLWSTVVARTLPVGNFTLVNLVAGAVGVPFRAFVLGSSIGILPGIVAMTFIVRQLGAVVTKHTLSAWLAAGLSILAFIVLSLLIARAVRSRQVVRAFSAEDPK